ncbi:hypothetical protein [Nostoc sp. DSM 114167]|jgi:hypothetical protein|uniref:hypothetical protein n=1 Tax=Nostoc sp. DSM 114167 TaxID=3439050 RepID=UPI004046423F
MQVSAVNRTKSDRRYRICEKKAIIACVQASFFRVAAITLMAQASAVGDRTTNFMPPYRIEVYTKYMVY